MKINFLNGLYEERCDVHEFHERPLCEKMQLKQKDLVFLWVIWNHYQAPTTPVTLKTKIANNN